MKGVSRQFEEYINTSSLRTRFLYASVILAVIVLSSAWFTGRYVADTSYASSRDLAELAAVQDQSQLIRDALWNAQNAIQRFVLGADLVDRQVANGNLEAASAAILQLNDNAWMAVNNLATVSRQIESDLEELRSVTSELIKIRQDVDLLFPSLSLLDDVLYPANRDFQTAVDLALGDIENDYRPELEEMRRFLEDIRHSWSEMVSAFRIYIVRQTGIYGASARDVQLAGHDIMILHEYLTRRLGELQLLVKGTDTGIQVQESLRQMESASRDWLEGFSEYRDAQESDTWRSDIPLLEAVVRPLFNRIGSRLGQIDLRLEATTRHSVSEWALLSDSLIQNIWVLSLLAFFLIVFSYWYIEKSVLAPLSRLGTAMTAVASGEDHETLPEVTSVEARDLINAFEQMRDKVQERHVELERRTLHDPLTGLPNRVLMIDRLKQQILTGRRDGPSFCLMIMDLDRFKEINDSLGHQTGDRVLCEVGKRLRLLLRETDTVARLGGDEFSVLMPDSTLRQAQELAQVTANALEQPFEFDDKHLLLGVSIGIAVFPDHGKDSETLIKRADVAMYIAKQNGLPHSVYRVQEDMNSVGRLALISELRQAIDQDELELHYQPKLEMESGRIVGVEALLRWPQWRDIATGYLIETAEQTGLIRPLTQWVLRSAISQYVRWRGAGVSLSVAVNVSSWILQQGELPEQIKDLLAEYQVPASALELEIKENAVMRNPERALAVVEELRQLGLAITLDDYGTGFSSLTYLKQMAVDQIKIDSSFVADMFENDDSALIVRSTIDLAHNLDVKVVAEGVSSQEVWDLLMILNCDYAQGYLLAEPMSASDLEAWLADRFGDRAGHLA